MIPKLIGAVIAAVALASCKPRMQDSEVKIRGGSDAKKGEYPAVVMVLARGSLCTGTFITPNVVLTATHCTCNADADEILVRSEYKVPGFASTSTDTKRRISFFNYAVVKKYEHPNLRKTCSDKTYSNSQKQADLAVLKVSSFVHHPYLKLGSAPDLGDSITLVGYGQKNNYKSSAGQKRVGNNKVIREKIGSLINRRDRYPGMIQANETGGATIGHGDSGGPLLNSSKQVIGVSAQKISDLSGGPRRSIWVDLNSKSSRSFLSAYPGKFANKANCKKSNKLSQKNLYFFLNADIDGFRSSDNLVPYLIGADHFAKKPTSISESKLIPDLGRSGANFLADSVNAAFQAGCFAYFFVDREYFKYDLGEMKPVKGLKPTKSLPGLNVLEGLGQVWAAVHWGDGAVSLFSGSMVYIYDIFTQRLMAKNDIKAFWPQLVVKNDEGKLEKGVEITAATNLNNKWVYLFSGKKYWKFHAATKKMVKGYPLFTVNLWPSYQQKVEAKDYHPLKDNWKITAVLP